MNIKDVVFPGGGHIVILGAGASIASTMLDPEREGKSLPSMNNLQKIIQMDDLLSQISPRLYSENFETLYSNIHREDSNNPILGEINERICNYFSSLSLPSKPTIYDYLVMSLRPRDVIFTFNWDPFLYQAWCRNYKYGSNPRIHFLHGNVAIGYDYSDLKAGPSGFYRSDNKHYFIPSPLLYPTGIKNYEEDPFIKKEWKYFKDALSSDIVCRVTIFGYSAPISDMAAIKVMSESWGTTQERNLEQFELIDIRPEDEVKSSWDAFIHTHHYDFCNSYFESSLARCPRRTCESYHLRYFPMTPEEAFHDEYPIPTGGFKTFEEMWEWHQELIEVENKLVENPI